MKGHFLWNASITLNSPIFGWNVFHTLWVYLIRLLVWYMVSEEQMTPECVTPVSHHFRVLKVQWNQVIFLWNWPKTRSPCTVHVALSLAAGKSPSLCISRLHVSLSRHIWGDGMTLPSTTPLACLMRSCCFSTDRWWKIRRQSCDLEGEIHLVACWSLKLSFEGWTL